MSGGSRQPLQPKILLSMMDVLTSRTACDPIYLDHSQRCILRRPLGWCPHKNSIALPPTSKARTPGLPPPTAPPQWSTWDGRSLCFPERKQSLQITAVHWFYKRSGGKMTTVNSLLYPAWTQSIDCSRSRAWKSESPNRTPCQDGFSRQPHGLEVLSQSLRAQCHFKILERNFSFFQVNSAYKSSLIVNTHLYQFLSFKNTLHGMLYPLEKA